MDKRLLNEIENYLTLMLSSGNQIITKAASIMFTQKLREAIKSYQKVFPAECAELSTILYLSENSLLADQAAIAVAKKIISHMHDHFDEAYKPPKLFISHSTEDVLIVEKFVTMLEQVGVKQSQLFCSSIKGYGIPQGVGDLYHYIRTEMSNDNLFVIMMLSPHYYKSPVCLNEMGAAWVKQSAYQSILLPGFHYSEIKGAVNPRDMSFSLSDLVNRNLALNEFKNRIIAHLGMDDIDHSLWERFRDKFTLEVDQIVQVPPVKNSTPRKQQAKLIEFSTDDERIILWYVVSKKVRKLKKSDVLTWLQSDEIYDVNVDNAFDLLSTIGNCEITKDILELDVNLFRKLIEENNTDVFMKCFAEHRQLGSENILRLWDAHKIDDALKLFLAYIIEERISTFGDRWLAEHQVAHIKEWEDKSLLDETLSGNYSSCLNLFIQNHFVFESSWTSYGNPREYKLCPSLEKMLLVEEFPYSEELETVKAQHQVSLPF